MTRRELLRRSGATLLGLAASPWCWGWNADAQRRERRILLFTRSAGFEHSVVKRADGKLAFVEQIVTDLGAKHGFEVTCTKDGTVFTPENLAQYDAFFFYTTGDLTKPSKDGSPPMTPEGKAAFLNAIHAGKGFIGTHAATDTFHTEPDTPDRANRYINHVDKADPYIRMIGAEFIKHGKQQVATNRVVDHHFPGFESLPDSFQLMEEWYGFHDYAPNLHVLLVQESAGMTGPDYQRPPYPSTWARMHGRGRVFYTGLGHREDVWTNPLFQQILLGGISWAVGNAKADVMPNLATVTPGYAAIPPRG